MSRGIYDTIRAWIGNDGKDKKERGCYHQWASPGGKSRKLVNAILIQLYWSRAAGNSCKLTSSLTSCTCMWYPRITPFWSFAFGGFHSTCIAVELIGVALTSWGSPGTVTQSIINTGTLRSSARHKRTQTHAPCTLTFVSTRNGKITNKCGGGFSHEIKNQNNMIWSNNTENKKYNEIVRKSWFAVSLGPSAPADMAQYVVYLFTLQISENNVRSE